jgi:hypothetical protein
MVCGDHSYWVHKPCVVAKAENLLSPVPNPELTIVLDESDAAQVEQSQAIIDDISLEDSAAFAEKGLSKSLAHLQFVRSEGESFWEASVFPMAMRSEVPTSGMTEMLAEKMK